MAKTVKVSGEYLRRTDSKTTIIDFYEEDFIIDSVKTKGEALSVIKNGLLHDRLRSNENYSGYKRYRTHEVVSFEDTNEKSNNGRIEKLTREAVDLGCVPSNLDMYSGKGAKEKVLQKSIDSTKKRREKKNKSKDSLEDID